MKKILTIGDSFTYGEELSDITNNWPNLLAKKISYDLTNLAEPGKSNNYMVRSCIEYADDYDIIIIAWSHYARAEFADNWGVYEIWPGCRRLQFDGELKHRQNLINYVTQYHNDRYMYRQYLTNIILLQKYFKAIDKKYIMIDSFGNHQDLERKNNYDLYKKIKPEYFLGWPTESMMEWTYGCPQGINGHFLEQGHIRVADKIYEYIRHLGWIS